MNDKSVTALLLGALSIAALHALIPSHWLAFALIGQAQRWRMRRTLLVTALAGTGHALLTVILGIVLVVVGKGLLHAIPASVEHLATALLLIVLGLYFVVSSLRRGKGCHHHAHEHPADIETVEATGHSDAAAEITGTNIEMKFGMKSGPLGKDPTMMGALVMGMTLSPCLDLLSVYVAASAFSWPVLGAICLIMTATTVGLMVLLVWLTLHGLRRVRLQWLERNEGTVVGVTLILLGILLFFL